MHAQLTAHAFHAFVVVFRVKIQLVPRISLAAKTP
jgi:hypothetical protein